MRCLFGWLFVAGVVARILYALLRRRPPAKLPAGRPWSTLIVLGSGGHTAEMLRVLEAIDRERYSPRRYVIAADDDKSETKVRDFESRLAKEDDPSYCIERVPRARRVGQSYATSAWSTLRSLLACAPLAWRARADVVLCNGPGTCVPVCLAAKFSAFALRRTCKVVFVESACRIETLSLAGRVLLQGRIADAFVVQWPSLQEKYPRAEYLGRLS